MFKNHRVNGYRVLLSKDQQEQTWDFDSLWDAQNKYRALTIFDRCMILELSPINVKLVQEKKSAKVKAAERIKLQEQEARKKHERRRKTHSVNGRVRAKLNVPE